MGWRRDVTLKYRQLAAKLQRPCRVARRLHGHAEAMAAAIFTPAGGRGGNGVNPLFLAVFRHLCDSKSHTLRWSFGGPGNTLSGTSKGPLQGLSALEKQRRSATFSAACGW